MLRRTVASTSRLFSTVSARRFAVPASFKRVLATPVISSTSLLRRIPQVAPSWTSMSVRCYGASAGLSKEEITGRILELLKNFDKVKDETKLTETSNFSNDLGLDSLDTVEVVMAIEEEFGIEIHDKDADKIHSVEHAVAFVHSQPDAH